MNVCSDNLNKLQLERLEEIEYMKLMYQKRISLEKDHERHELEECMKYVYPEYLKKKAKILSYDFCKIEKYEEKNPTKNENKTIKTSFSPYFIILFSVIFGISTAITLILTFLGICK